MRYEWTRVPESVPPAPAVRDAKPVMISVDDDPGVSRAVQRDLRRQYGEHYRVLRAESGAQGLEMLGQVRLRDEPVALMVADQRMPQMTGVEFLERALEVAPDAKRVLLTAYADTQAAIDAINKVGARPLPAEAVGPAGGAALPGARRPARRLAGRRRRRSWRCG